MEQNKAAVHDVILSMLGKYLRLFHRKYIGLENAGAALKQMCIRGEFISSKSHSMLVHCPCNEK